MTSYFAKRKQYVKLGNFKSDFKTIFSSNTKLYNYADDNTVAHADKNLKRHIDELVEDSMRLIQ